MESIQKNRSAFIALGGNQASSAGLPEQTIAAALQAIAGESVRIAAVSRFYRSPAYPPGSGPEFVNAVAGISTCLSAEALLAHLHAVEAGFGRERQDRWGARTLDLDLIAVEQVVVPDAQTVQAWVDLAPERQSVEAPNQLLLPHPRLQDRAFVLIPLAEIAATWCHPISGRTVAAMAAALPRAAIAAICPF